MAPKVGISDIRKDQLTKAAMKCIASKGYDRVTLDDVTQEAGLSKGIASYYFKNREELLISVIRQMSDDIVSLTKDIFGLPKDINGENDLQKRLEAYYANPEIDPVSLIKTGIRTLLNILEHNPNIIRVVLEFWAQTPRNPVITELNNSMQKHLQDTSATIIAEGIKRGVFKQLDPQVASNVLVSSIAGFALSQILFGQVIEKDVLEKSLSDLVLSYLCV